ncbi:MAG: rhodanese-like domain-containing protein [Verrucomicrobia bacterium]|nr:rhodanese-like domain-containing protein [Verrucomicrobiota bacterium]
MKSRSSFLAAILLVASVLSHAQETKTQPSQPPVAAAKAFKNIGVDEFQKLTADKKNVILDVRTPKEFAAGHIAGAVNIDFNAPDFEKKIRELDKNKTYLVHCAAGVRSTKACHKMEGLNFKQLFNLEPGFKAWEKAGKPVQR